MMHVVETFRFPKSGDEEDKMEDRGLRPHFPLLDRPPVSLPVSIYLRRFPPSHARSLRRPNIIGAQRRMFPPAAMQKCLSPAPAIPSPAMNSLLPPPNRPRPPRPPRPTHTHFTPVSPPHPPSLSLCQVRRRTAGDGREELRKLSPGRYAKTRRPAMLPAYRATLTGIRERAAAPSNGPAHACKVVLNKNFSYKKRLGTSCLSFLHES